MIVTDEFHLDVNRREVLNTVSEEHPYTCLDVTLDFLIGRGWHWHNAFELDIVTSGCMLLRTPMKTIELYPGDVVFINYGILHDARAKDANKKCHLYAQLFYPIFLSGAYGSLLDKKYVQPLQNCTALDTWVFRATEERSGEGIISLTKTLIERNRTDDFGYELGVRSLLGSLWIKLLEITQEYRKEHVALEHISSDAQRMRIMIGFLQDHYMDSIRVSDIAASASLSIRECNRCFQRNVGIPPGEFLMAYRLRMAARLLLVTDQSVTLIASECGFSSASHFGKFFRERFGVSPLHYRRHEDKY